jgi:hypothetical protein
MLAPLLLLVAFRFLPLPARADRSGAFALLCPALRIQPSNRDLKGGTGTAWARFVEATPPGDLDLGGALVVVPGWHAGQ